VTEPFRIILASASPRRHALLREAGVEFEIVESCVEEDFDPSLAPEAVACELAARKALHVASGLSGQRVLVIGADTIVAVDVAGAARILGKPESEVEAAEMLRMLSSSRHRVITGVSVVDCSRGSHETAFERTWVTMRVLTPNEVEGYVASGEWRGKAGGYAIQENADKFVTQLEEGGFDNVVGLPVERTLSMLRAQGALLA